MWFPEEYVLSVDTVWYSPDGSVRFLCIPDTGPGKGVQRFCGLLHGMKPCTDSSGVWCLCRLQELAEQEMLPPSKLLSEIDLMAAQVQSYSGIPLI